MMRANIWLGLVLVGGWVGQGPVCLAAEASQHVLVRLGAAGGGKILFLGNSITRHGPKADIGWTNNCGMAATALEKDYVHVLTAAIAKQIGKQPDMLAASLVDFERGYVSYDVATKTKPFTAFKADLIILAIGENTAALTSAAAKAAYKECLVKLLTALKQGSNPVIFVRSCFWANKAKDDCLREAAAATGCVFVDISALAKDEKNYARSEQKLKNAGVANHPGDRGMQALADALFAALKNQK
jgi:lysophospholipase L1-like esterase